MEKEKREVKIWKAKFVDLDGEEWEDDLWYGDYDNYMEWIDAQGYDVVDVWQVDEEGKRID